MNEHEAIKAMHDKVEVECFDGVDQDRVTARGRIVGYQSAPTVLIYDEYSLMQVSWAVHLARVAPPEPCHSCGLYPDGSKS